MAFYPQVGINPILMSRSGIIFFSSISIILVTSWIVVSSLTPYGSATSPDSLAYMDIANNIKNGKGFLETDFSLDNAGAHTFKAIRYWPPLYAGLLSVFINNASDVATISIISRILLGIGIVFIFLITYEVIGPIALIPTLLLCFTVPIITIYTYAWSETLFLPVFIIAIWSSIEYLKIGHRPFIHRTVISLVLLTMLIMLAYTRYIGIAFVILLPAVYFFSNRDTLDRLILSAAVFVYTIAVGYLLYDNYMITGYMSGMARAPSDKTVVDNFIDIYHVILAIIPTTALPIIIALITTVLIVFFIKINSKHTVNSTDKKSRHQVYILIIVTSVYLFTIISLRCFKRFDMLDIRLLSPALVTTFMLMAILPSFFNIKNRTGTLAYAVSFFFIACLSINGYVQWQDTTKNWEVMETPNLGLNNKLVYSNFTKNHDSNEEINKLFSRLTRNNGVIVVNKPLIYKFITGKKCVQIPEPVDSENLLKIDSLTAGSILLLNKHEFHEIINKYIRRKSIYKYFRVDGLIALHLPIKISGR